MKRLFICAEFDIPLVEKLGLAQHAIQHTLTDSWRPVTPENIHLTLKFLGDTPEPLTERIQETLHNFCRELFPFEISVTGIGGFPDMTTPRIIWAHLSRPSAELLGLLQKNLEHEMEKIGIDPDPREYIPHITLGRVQKPAQPDLTHIQPEGTSYVRELILMSSTLGHHSPIYTVLDRFHLGPQ